MASELLIPETLATRPPTTPQVFEPLIYPFGSPPLAPAGRITLAQASYAPNVVGAVGSQPIIKVSNGNGFLAELLPRLEGLGITLTVAAVAFAILDPKTFSNLVLRGSKDGWKLAVKAWPTVDNSLQTIFEALGEVIDNELSISSVSNNFHWWCIFGPVNQVIPWCKTSPWYCDGLLAWVSQSCRGTKHQKGSFDQQWSSMESFLYDKEQAYQNEISSWISSEESDIKSYISSLVSSVESDVEDTFKDVIKPFKSGFKDIEKDIKKIDDWL